MLITDTSHWKGKLDFKTIKECGVKANIAKATEGYTFLDDQFFPSVDNMILNNLLWGSYHYYRVQIDPIKQAKHYFNAAKETQLLPCIDVERINNLGYSKKVFTDNLYKLVKEAENLFGRKVMIYTGYYVWNELTTNPAWAKENILWMAAYSNIRPTRIPSPWGVGDFKLWQYTDRERVGPYSLDCSQFFGTEEELLSLSINYTPAISRIDELEDRVEVLEKKVIDLGNGYGIVN